MMLTKTKVLGFTTSERKEAPVKEGKEAEDGGKTRGINAKVTRKKEKKKSKEKKERSRIMKLAFLVYRGSNLTRR